MPPTFQLSGIRIALAGVTIVIAILLPIVLGVLAHRRLGVSWRYFGYGALIFFLFQIISRVPAVALIQARLGPQLSATRWLQFAFGAALALTAALFEEVGRYVGYRWLMGREEKTWDKAIMYGLGHSGLESMLLVGGLGLAQLIGLIILSRTNLSVVPEPQRAAAAQQLAALTNGPPWVALLGAWERMWTIIVHVALSVLVLQVFRRNSLSWLWLAILIHTLLDLFPTILPLLLPNPMVSILIIEAVVAVFGLLGLWIIRRLRDSASTSGRLQPA